VTRRLTPEECLFGIFGAALIALVGSTGALSLVFSRPGEAVKFLLIVTAVAAVIFARGYFRAPATPGLEGVRFVIDRPRARTGLRLAAKAVREFGPLFACLALYEALHDLTPVLRPQVDDDVLVQIDRAVFHVDVARWLDDHIGSPTTTQVLTVCYISYAFASPIYAGVQYFRGRFRAFHDLALAITVTAFIGYTGYLLLPAVGPYLYQPSVYADVLPGSVHGGVLDLISHMKGSARDAFPSLHTAMTTVVLAMMWRDARRLFWAYLPLALGLYLSTMYLRFHYATDVAAGFVTAGIALFVAPKINRWWYAQQVVRRSPTAIPSHISSPDSQAPSHALSQVSNQLPSQAPAIVLAPAAKRG
jgi:membrane-associated phospholipid phosphatase